jgi:hypothetical protein
MAIFISIPAYYSSFHIASSIINMTITPELQGKFNSSFHRIMKQTSPELQKKWNGVIEWPDMKSYPHIEPTVIQELPAGAKAAYITLLNKLSRGNI